MLVGNNRIDVCWCLSIVHIAIIILKTLKPCRFGIANRPITIIVIIHTKGLACTAKCKSYIVVVMIVSFLLDARFETCYTYLL